MAKSRKKQKIEAKNKADERKFFKILAIITVVLLIFLFFIFMK